MLISPNKSNQQKKKKYYDTSSWGSTCRRRLGYTKKYGTIENRWNMSIYLCQQIIDKIVLQLKLVIDQDSNLIQEHWEPLISFFLPLKNCIGFKLLPRIMREILKIVHQSIFYSYSFIVKAIDLKFCS